MAVVTRTTRRGTNRAELSVGELLTFATGESHPKPVTRELWVQLFRLSRLDDAEIASLSEADRALVARLDAWMASLANRRDEEAAFYQIADLLHDDAEDEIIISKETTELEELERPIDVVQNVVETAKALPAALDDAVEVALMEAEEAVAERARVEFRLLGGLAVRANRVARLQAEMALLATKARDQGVTWTDIGAAAGIGSQAAYRRWDPEGRRRQAEYQRKRREQPGTEVGKQ